MTVERPGVELLATLRRDRVAAVIRAPRINDPVALTESLVSAGVHCVEFTFTTAGALDAIRAGSAVQGAMVGAGTVLTADQARAAIEAGAQFVVSPGLTLDVVEPCRSAGIPYVLGALTPSEVLAAVRAGTTVVKLFPAGLGGPRYLKDLRGPLPDVDFVPSGGVSVDNAAQFLQAGAIAVFAGSDLVSADAIARGDFAEVAASARAFRAAVGGLTN
jgi:2-dehydro-3-deoxyphosphogluconate aldolase/(4S)-4-hydroxy-2-oxoglutarate aldolase